MVQQPETGNQAAMSPGRRDWSPWPRYEAAVLGFRNYWYPVMWSGSLGSKPMPIMLLGEKLMLIRDRGQPYALHDRCLHRGTPLSIRASSFGRRTYAKQVFPGTISCGYHGWTYDLASGLLVAALTDGPDSPICGKVRVRTYPVEERIGLVWVYMGEGEPPPVEADIPEELVNNKIAVGGRITVREGNWRSGAENGIDAAHPWFLHRNSLFMLFNRLPSWTRNHIEAIQDGKWITYVPDEVHFEDEYRGLGSWPRRKWWQKVQPGGYKIAIRMPCMLRVIQPTGWTHYAWYEPVDADHHRYFQLAVKFASGLEALRFKLHYWAYLRWINHVIFNNQDAVMVKVMDSPPERLFRPDASVLAWRRLCEEARGTTDRRTEVLEVESKQPVKEFA